MYPLRSAFAVSHRFWIVVSSFLFVSRKFLSSSLISFLPIHCLIACYSISMFLSVLDFFSLRFVSSFSPLWLEKMLDMISIFMNLLRLVLCPIMWSMFENVPCAFEKNVSFASWGQKALSLSIYIYQLSPFHLGHCSMP